MMITYVQIITLYRIFGVSEGSVMTSIFSFKFSSLSSNAHLSFVSRMHLVPSNNTQTHDVWMKRCYSDMCNIQFNSIQKLYLKMVYNLSSLGPSKHVNKYNKFSYMYTKQHRFIGQSQANTTYTFIQKHIHKHSYLTYTMYIQTCTFTTLYQLWIKRSNT